jgi:hypothetical protein
MMVPFYASKSNILIIVPGWSIVPVKLNVGNTGFPRSSADLKIINVLFSLSKQKKIVKTEIQGRDGTIKEYIGEVTGK